MLCEQYIAWLCSCVHAWETEGKSLQQALFTFGIYLWFNPEDKQFSGLQGESVRHVEAWERGDCSVASLLTGNRCSNREETCIRKCSKPKETNIYVSCCCLLFVENLKYFPSWFVMSKLYRYLWNVLIESDLELEFQILVRSQCLTYHIKLLPDTKASPAHIKQTSAVTCRMMSSESMMWPHSVRSSVVNILFLTNVQKCLLSIVLYNCYKANMNHMDIVPVSFCDWHQHCPPGLQRIHLSSSPVINTTYTS